MPERKTKHILQKDLQVEMRRESEERLQDFDDISAIYDFKDLNGIFIV